MLLLKVLNQENVIKQKRLLLSRPQTHLILICEGFRNENVQHCHPLYYLHTIFVMSARKTILL